MPLKKVVLRVGFGLGIITGMVVVVFAAEEGVVVVVVVVNTMARGKHRRSAHKRENGFGDSIAGLKNFETNVCGLGGVCFKGNGILN